MKPGKRWSVGAFAFYFGTAGGAIQALPTVRSLPITPDDVLPSMVTILEGVVVGTLTGAAIAWIRNLFLR